MIKKEKMGQYRGLIADADGCIELLIIIMVVNRYKSRISDYSFIFCSRF